MQGSGLVLSEDTTLVFGWTKTTKSLISSDGRSADILIGYVQVTALPTCSVT